MLSLVPTWTSLPPPPPPTLQLHRHVEETSALIVGEVTQGIDREAGRGGGGGGGVIQDPEVEVGLQN